MIDSNFFELIYEQKISPEEGMLFACNSLIGENITIDDNYEALDIYNSCLPIAKRLDIDQRQFPLNTVGIDISYDRKIYDDCIDVSNIICDSPSHICSMKPANYWTGSLINIFFNPIMIGFGDSHDVIKGLGWGSELLAGFLANKARTEDKAKILNVNNTAVILTRHGSKYAHFVRDRLSKIIWAKYFSGFNTIENFVFDYPLSEEELMCLHDFGIKANIYYASNYGQYLSLQGNNIIVFEVGTGMNYMKFFEKYLRNYTNITNKSLSTRYFLKRGPKGSRREAINHEEVEKIFESFDYHCIDLSELSYIEQLTYCLDSEYVAGFHGAQLINGHSAKHLVEIHSSFPYFVSNWSKTMAKMCIATNKIYFPILLFSNGSYANDMKNKNINDLRFSLGNYNNPKTGQSDKFYINTKSLSEYLSLLHH